MKKNRLLLLSLVVWTIILVIYAIDYFFSDSTLGDLSVRQIESSPKLWLNGYLGTFFYFKTLGNLNWLVLFIFVYAILYWHKNTEAEKFGIVFFLTALLVISYFGYTNYRYAFTLLPLIFIILFNKGFLFTKNLNVNIKVIYIQLFALLALNYFYFYFAKSYLENLESASKMVNGSTISKPSESKVLVQHGHGTTQSKEEKGVQKQATKALPIQIISFINHYKGKTNTSYMVNELPLFYYYTSQKGINYSAAANLLYLESGKKPLFIDGRSVKSYLADSINTSFLLSNTEKLNESSQWKEFVLKNSFLILEENNYQLYKFTF